MVLCSLFYLVNDHPLGTNTIRLDKDLRAENTDITTSTEIVVSSKFKESLLCKSIRAVNWRRTENKIWRTRKERMSEAIRSGQQRL